MIELEIKSMSSPDVEIQVWEAASRADVWFLLELEIGLAREERSDIFQLMVATPEGLRKNARGEVISKRATLVVSDFSWEGLRTALQTIITDCTGKDWNESVLRLQRYFLWEYEDYVQSKDAQ